jgi:hypothetical protein
VTFRAEWERIWIDDQGVAIARDRFLDGRHVRIKFLCPRLQPRLSHTARANHGMRFEGILKIDLQGNRTPKAKIRQIRLLVRAQSFSPYNGF